jgi:hypothetical protein
MNSSSWRMPLSSRFLSLGTAILMILITNGSAKDKASETFLKKAVEGNYAEVSMGDLAQKNGQSDSVKSFGQMLSTDHTAANQKALDTAKSMEMNPPTGPMRSNGLTTTRCQNYPAHRSTKCSQHTWSQTIRRMLPSTRKPPRLRMLLVNMLQPRSIRCRNI